MKKIYVFILLLITVYATTAQPVITGRVSDNQGNALVGVEFFLTEACVNLIGISDSTGHVTFSTLPENTGKICYRFFNDLEYFGMVDVKDNSFELVIDENDLIISPGHGIESSEKRSAFSVASVTREELMKSSEGDVAKALYGQLPGLSVMQPGVFGTPNMYVRGHSTFGNNTPLVLVDGFERDLTYYSIGEIESVTVLKDAVAAALYGVRGANGVIAVKTRRGNIGKPKVEIRYNNNQYSPFRPVEMASAPAYARALNEALVNDGLPERYSAEEVAAFESGNYPYAYPDVNWKREVFNDRPTGHLFDFTTRGGRENFKYFSAVSYSHSGGYFNEIETTSRNDHKYSNTLLNIKGNVDVNVTKSTLLSVGLLTHLSQQQDPGDGAGNINASVYDIPSAAFPVYSGEDKVFASNSYFARNPVAMVNYSGFTKRIDQALFFDTRLRQDLSAILPGLTAEAALSYDFHNLLREAGRRNYKYEVISAQITEGNVETSKTSFSEDTPMDYSDNIIGQFINTNIEGRLNYSKSSAGYNLNTSLIYEQNFYFLQGRNNTEKRQAYKAFGSLVLEDKYLFNAVLNYAGSAKLPEGDRFRLYPAVSAAWVVSNEPFFAGSSGTSLKLRGSYGISGSDLFSHDLWRTNYRGGGAVYFNNNISSYGSNQPGILPTLNLNYETAQKVDFGFDLSLFNDKFNFKTDLFYENRKNILVPGSNVISGVLGLDVSDQVDGVINTRGFEAILSWQEKQNDFEYKISGNFAFARAKVIENNEGFLPYDYLSRKNNSLTARYGLEAIGFFSSDMDIAESPLQMFSEVRPGDIKYQDQNGDEVIDELDIIKISDYGAIPEIYYGFDIHLKYKGLGFYALLQGVANRNIYTNSRNIFFPLQNNTNISAYYLEQRTRWTQQTAGMADAPRLTTQDNANNFRLSDVWLENGSYLKLRNVEVYYDLPPFGFDTRIFVRGANLFSLDKLKDFDPENYSIGYPSLSSYTMGIQIKF